MKRAKFFTGKILSLFILLQLFAPQLRAQNELTRPVKMSEGAFRHFKDMIKYNDPDSLIYYHSGEGQQAYMKVNFIYNNRHQPLIEDEYTRHERGYLLVQRTIKTYDPYSAILRITDIRVIDEAYKYSSSTRTLNMFIYDSIGNLALRYTVDTLNGTFVRANGDSMIYTYDRSGVPLAERTYFFGYIGSGWIPDRIYKVESVGTDGNPKVITVSVVNTERQIIPIRQYTSIAWARRCNSLEGIDTLATEYTVALFYDGKWIDNYKKVNAFNAQGKLDSSIVYTFKSGNLQPSKKDVYSYKGGLDFKSKLYYEYLNGKWKLTAGTRRTLTFGDDGGNRYYLNVKEEVYEIPYGADNGNWIEQNNIMVK